MTPSQQLKRLLEEQRQTYLALDEAGQTRLLALLQAAEKQLQERLKRAIAGLGEDAFSAHTLTALRLQAQAAVFTLQGELEKGLQSGQLSAARAGLDAIWRQVELLEGPPPPGLRVELAQRLLQGSQRGLRLTEVVKRYGQDVVARIEERLVVNTLTQLPRQQAIKALQTAVKDSFELSESRGRLIFRNELSNGYDAAALETQQALQSELTGSTDPLLARMDEAHDRRNHPFSRVAHGTVAQVGQPWRVPVGAVAEMGARMGLGATGIVWPTVDGQYVGRTYIAHHNDRGRRTCWRRSWGDPLNV